MPIQSMRRTLVALLLGAAAAVSCRHPITSAGIVVESYPRTQVKVNDTLFGGHFRVAQTALAKGDNGLLQATVTLENRQSDCQIEYRYRWLDGQGIEVRSGTSVWTPLGVAARESKFLTGIAPSRQAADFVLDVRFSHKSTRW